jgi:ABC-type antimicrobial peptide transport system permease subunit
VVADVKARQYAEETGPAFYVYSRQMAYIVGGQFVVRLPGDPAPFIPTLRAAITGFDSRIAIASVETMRTLMGRTVANQQYRATLSSAFGVAALVLAAIGLFGLLSRAVSERHREIGVRIAVGARPVDVVRLIVSEAGRPVAVGLLTGIVAALGASRAIQSQLYGVRPTDPHTFVLVSAVLMAAALAATVLPALRASRVDPVTSLRAD